MKNLKNFPIVNSLFFILLCVLSSVATCSFDKEISEEVLTIHPSQQCIIVPQRTYILLSKEQPLPDIVMMPLCPCIGVIAQSDRLFFASHTDFRTDLNSLRDVIYENFTKEDCEISLYTTDPLKKIMTENYEKTKDHIPWDPSMVVPRLRHIESLLKPYSIQTFLFEQEEDNSLYFPAESSWRSFNISDYVHFYPIIESLNNLFFEKYECEHTELLVQKGEYFSMPNDAAPLIQITVEQWESCLDSF
ncbi:MAG: hypothetical protein GY915_04755 [bacterium]|nr:hypothetical protein [bacterium]